ncbi:hypothetical protein FSP39_021646 [Pinctada imbricata]|uniref:Uncharacterized protein n=1 Tax=Pinctada imbricata TaxID=66713 RepID=A0AA88YXQ1_PINIB|nr:hypothetical protein FSP39_021646 [Pinctada imbricata]
MFSSISSNVIVSSDGNITWLSMVIFKSSCSINVRFFPFDEQNCSMTFASWTYDGFQLNLLLTTNEGDISNYIPNSEWTLMKLYVEKKVMYYSCCIEPYPDITYYIYIRRRPLFYIFNMVLPCILITLVALLGFYIPSDSGEKVTMGITTLLSMTVFMMLVAENMPPTSNVLPLIGIYYGITICIVSFATGMTVFTLNIHHKGHRGRPVPPILKKIFFGVFAKILCLKIDVAEAPLSKVTYTPDVAKRGSGPIPFKLTTDEQSVKHANVKSKQRIYLDQHPMNRYQVRLDSSKQNNNSQLPTNVQSPNGLHTLQNIDSNNTDQFEQNFSKVMNKVYGAIENNESRIAQQDKRDAIKLEWQQVALVVDRILLSLFVTVTLTMTCAILIQGPVSQT